MSQGREAVEMVGVGEESMDTSGPFGRPVNPLPERCPHCTFPDVDAVPAPYRLARKIQRPTEASGAAYGNFFVKDRPRAILEAVAPGACRFVPTVEARTGGPTPWWLAVPQATVPTGEVKPEIPRCPACGEPKVAFKGLHFDWRADPRVDPDVCKGREWYSTEEIGEESRWYWMNVLKLKQAPEPREGQWTRIILGRDLFFSVRLETLWKRAGIKGLIRAAGDKAKPGPDDLAWVDTRMALLAERGLLAETPATATIAPAAAATPFARYLKANTKTKKSRPDFARVEAKLGRPLPPSYKAFIEAVGPKTFEDIDGEEGFVARILAPAKLDLKAFRQGAIADFDPDDEDSPKVDGLMFAATDHGDAFVLDLAGGAAEPPVLLYNHEGNYFEPYAADFPAAILAWAAPRD